jgi:hypothetical protein
LAETGRGGRRSLSLFAREVLGFLVGRELLSPEWAERILAWRHTGSSVHSRVRAKTKKEAERVGRLSFEDKEDEVIYRYGKEAKETNLPHRASPIRSS